MKSYEPSDRVLSGSTDPAVPADKMLRLVFKALDEVNLQLPSDRRISKTPQTKLFGRQGELDSLGLVSFVAALEAFVEEDCGVRVNLADADAMSQTVSPLQSVELLSAYLTHRTQST